MPYKVEMVEEGRRCTIENQSIEDVLKKWAGGMEEAANNGDRVTGVLSIGPTMEVTEITKIRITNVDKEGDLYV